MKFLAALALTFAAASCNTTTDRVEWMDYGADPMANPLFMADMMEAGTPGPQHAELASRAGTWSVDGKMWMAPGADPMPMKARARIEVLMDGRYTVEEFRSDFMGMPFEGRLLSGFDNLTQEYWCIWMDSMSTGYSISRGTETSPGHFGFHGTASDVLTPKGRPVRMTITDNSDGSYTMKMYDTREDGVEFESMELHYTRG